MGSVMLIQKLKTHIKTVLIKLMREKRKFSNYSHQLYTKDISYEIDMLLLPSFLREIEGPNFKQKYLNLIKGLDDESILTVARIISRALLLRNFRGGYIDFFSREEKDILDFLKYEYRPSFIKLEEGLFCYKGWLFPSDHVSPCAAYYEHFLGDLSSLSDISQKCIIDAGAFIGDSALFMSPYTAKQIFAFEPGRDNYELLLKTIELNGLSNVIPVNFGLGEREESINITKDLSASRCTNNAASNTETANITTLDDFVEKNSLDVGLIKVDVEGFERALLKGAVRTIKIQKPTLLLSIYHSGGDFFDIKKMIEDLDLGYRFKIKQQFAGSILAETLLIAETF